MAFERVADIADLAPGRTKFVLLDRGAVVLARVGEEVFALGGVCPHKGNPLDGATLIDHLLDCPWHHFQYDVRTGDNHFPANVYPKDIPGIETQLRPLKKYPVEVRDDGIWVDLG